MAASFYYNGQSVFGASQAACVASFGRLNTILHQIVQNQTVTVTAGTIYRLGLRRNDTGQVQNWYVAASDNTAATLATQFANEINNVVGGFVSATTTTTTLNLTQVTTTVDCQGFTAPLFPTGGVFTITQAYVASSGTHTCSPT